MKQKIIPRLVRGDWQLLAALLPPRVRGPGSLVVALALRAACMSVCANFDTHETHMGHTRDSCACSESSVHVSVCSLTQCANLKHIRDAH